MTGFALIVLTFIIPICVFVGSCFGRIKRSNVQSDKIYYIAALALGICQFIPLFFI